MREYRLWASASFVAVFALFIASIFIVSMQPLPANDANMRGFATTSESSLPSPPGSPDFSGDEIDGEDDTSDEENDTQDPAGEVSVAQAVQRSIAVGDFSDWSGISSYENTEVHPGHEDRSLPSDWSSSFKLAWDDDALYMFVDVVKDDIETGVDTFSLNDGVEILIGGSNSKSNSFQADDHQLQVRADGHVRQGLRYNDGAADNPEGVVVETQTTNDGYELEISISWDFIGSAAPEEDVVYGFTTSTIFYNHEESVDEKDVMVFWKYANSHFRETLEWSELELVGSSDSSNDNEDSSDSSSDDDNTNDDGDSGSSSSGGGGGSSSGSGYGYVPLEERDLNEDEEDACEADYVCGNWQPCSVDGDQTRTCIDQNECAEERVDRRDCQQVVQFQVEGSDETLQLTRESSGYSLEQGLAIGTRFTTDEDLGENATVRMGGQEYLLVRDGRLSYVLTEAPQKSVPQKISESVPEDDSRPAYWIWILVVGGIMGGAVAVLTRMHTEASNPQPKNALEQWLYENRDASDEQLFSALVSRGYAESRAREEIQKMRSEL